jgi:lysophospholipase L1-like esterase
MTTPTALFTGDSITDAGRRTDPSGQLGAGYVRRIAELARLAEVPLHVVNTGVGGDRTGDLIARWEVDVAALAPDILTIMIGINDMWRRYDGQLPTSEAQFEANYRAIIEGARQLPLQQLVLMEPFLVPITPEQESWHGEDLDAKIAITRQLAAEFNATCVPLDTLFNDEATAGGTASVIDDGVHPSAGGHELIARTWWKTMELNPS